ncbi:MAG: hypothetical protein LBR15_06365 [Methanobrevibacter sp.]|jgi:hypothetical protein|nr:hypothetical protein [Candidatus Methanovirga australis]
MNWFKKVEPEYYPLNMLEWWSNYRIYNDEDAYNPDDERFDFWKYKRWMKQYCFLLITFGLTEIEKESQMKRVKRSLLTNFFTIKNLVDTYGKYYEHRALRDEITLKDKLYELIAIGEKLLDKFQMFEKYPTTELSENIF